jgi:hypothetical protein
MSQPTTTTPAPVSGRPLGVAILAILLGLFGVLTLVGGLLVVVLSNHGLVFGATNLFDVSGTLLGIVLVLLGLIELGVAVGLWHLRMWALVVAVLVLLVDLFGPVVSLALGKAGTASLIGIIIPLILLIYLIAVRRHFS